MSNSHSKKEHFITLVHRALDIRLLEKEGYSGEVSFVDQDTLVLVDEIVDFAQKILPSMTAREAASTFVVKTRKQRFHATGD